MRGLHMPRTIRVEPQSAPHSFELLAESLKSDLGTQVDHFHCWYVNGDEIIINRETSGCYFTALYRDLFGWAHTPDEFARIEAHAFHGNPEKDTYRDSDPVRPENGFVRFLKRLVSW